MRSLLIAVCVWVVAGVLPAAAQESVVQLKERAFAAREAEQPKLFLEVAERQLQAADNAFSQGQTEAGKTAIEDVAEACEKAGAAATGTRKHLKSTEMGIRTLARKLDAMRQTLSFEDQAPLAAAIERMEQVRTDLLNAMFGPRS
jgi:hypothetical protein